jgi:hypothetical protein
MLCAVCFLKLADSPLMMNKADTRANQFHPSLCHRGAIEKWLITANTIEIHGYMTCRRYKGHVSYINRIQK